MKTLIALAALPLLAIATPALAQATDSDSADVRVTGRVAPLCILGEPSRATVDLGQMAATSGSRVGRIAVLPAQDVTLPGSFCNFAGSALTVSTTALVSDTAGSPPSGFARAVNYTATGSGWAASSTSATSGAGADGSNPTASGTGATQPLPKLADIQVQLSSFTVPSDALLLADNYNGLVTVTLGPAAVAE
jgi:type 1 fimbria pilin